MSCVYKPLYVVMCFQLNHLLTYVSKVKKVLFKQEVSFNRSVLIIFKGHCSYIFHFLHWVSASFNRLLSHGCVVADGVEEDDQQQPETIPEVSSEEVLVFELKVKCSRFPCPPAGATDAEQLYMNSKGVLVAWC